MSYIKLGDNFNKINEYDKSELWYKKAIKLNSKVASYKLSKLYINKGDRYAKIKKHQKAIKYYIKALNLGNKDSKKKISKSKKYLKHKKQLVNDTRKLVTNESPIWTKSIGRLIIPIKLEFTTKKRYKTKYKKCSASIINIDKFQNSKVLVTASHCLTSYNKEAGDIRFIVKNSKSEMVQRYATVYKDSHYSSRNLKTKSDYAILVLDKAISDFDVKGLKVSPNSFKDLKYNYKYSFGSLAGFSGDVGEDGLKLTYDPKCELNYFSTTYALSNCTGFKGASGGPVVLTVSDDNIKYKHYFVGVVSHFKNNKFQNIYFAPHHIFYDDLYKAINLYNYQRIILD